jgi:hypothetical protein
LLGGRRWAVFRKGSWRWWYLIWALKNADVNRRGETKQEESQREIDNENESEDRESMRWMECKVRLNFNLCEGKTWSSLLRDTMWEAAKDQAKERCWVFNSEELWEDFQLSSDYDWKIREQLVGEGKGETGWTALEHQVHDIKCFSVISDSLGSDLPKH